MKMYDTYLRSHDPLSLLDESAFRTLAVSVRTGLLVSSKAGDQAVVSTACAFRYPCSTTVHVPAGFFPKF